MFLKSLEIFGFKSFADRTRIEFSDGITALLGPNGCGKSNVVDAIKWVIGEQGAKALRAEKMEDVIFTGTENRKPLNVAEVTLTIANENGLLNLDLTEVAIKRRLYRSGESEYFINGKPVKLKEIRELFWDTGVGKVAYSVMEQGKIDQILSSKPEERRYLFEEAAGITRFKARRAAAERDLERTESYMQQSEVILAEVKREYDSLKKQADETARFRTLKNEEFENELDINLLRLKGFTQERDRRASSAEEAKKKRDAIKAEIDDISVSLEMNMSRVNAMQERMNAFMLDLTGLQVSKNEKMNLSRHLADRKNEIKAKIGQLEIRRQSMHERISSLHDDADEQDVLARQLASRLSDTEKNIASFEEAVDAAASRITGNDGEAARLEKEIAALEEQRVQFEAALQALTEDIVTELDKRLREAGYSSSAHSRAEETVADVIGRMKSLVSGRKNIFSDFTRNISPSAEEMLRFAGNAVDSFSELEELLGTLEEGFASLKKASPGFIDEFLAPEGIITKKRAVDAEIQQNRARCAEKRAAISDLKAENTGLSEKIEEYRKTLEDLRLNQVQMKTQSAAAEERAKLIRREIASQESQLRYLENEIFTEEKNLGEIDGQIADVDSELAEIERKGSALAAEMEELNNKIHSETSDVSGRQGKLKELNESLIKEQSRLEKTHMDVMLSETEIRNVLENFRERYSRDLMEFEERMFAITVPAADLREKLAAVRQQLKTLGSVNLQAPEQFEDAKERYAFLSGQLEDLRKAREDLRIVTEEIRAESTELFLATYNKIKKNFHNMFRRLFGGGRGELRLVTPANVLESGIDIFAQPPGKKLENIGLLSGGEKSMTAVALLFATYMVKPSPFCLLDEIDAALDEQNVTRFIHTLREFANVSQYIIITHNKKTVMGAGTMLGVTMEESGVTKLIAIKLENDIDYSPDEKLPDVEDFEEEDVAPEEGVVIPPRPDRLNRRGDASDPREAEGDRGKTEESAADGGGSSPAGLEGEPS